MDAQAENIGYVASFPLLNFSFYFMLELVAVHIGPHPTASLL